MGLIVNVYRQVNTYLGDGTAVMLDASNRGWSSRYSTVCLTNAKGPFSPNARNPAVTLIKGPGQVPHVVAVSEEHLNAGHWTQFGGCFLAATDQRFIEAIGLILGRQDHDVCAVKIHDRIE